MVKFTFKNSEIEEDVDLFCRFLNPGKGDWDWSKYILKEFPILRKIKKKSKYPKKEIREFLKRFREQNSEKIKKKGESFEKIFRKKQNNFLTSLFKIIELKKTNINKIEIQISLCPINPRDLINKKFYIYFNYKYKDMLAIAFHEILHFFYFEKWKKVFPKTRDYECEGPHLTWHLSEIVAPIILNDKKIQKIQNYKHKGYNEHLKLRFKTKTIFEIIEDFYKNRSSFKEFLRKSYKFIREHKKKIQSL